MCLAGTVQHGTARQHRLGTLRNCAEIKSPNLGHEQNNYVANNVASNIILLRSAPPRRARASEIQPVYSAELHSQNPSDPLNIGQCDAAFVKGGQPTYVELLIRISNALDAARLFAAAQSVLDNNFACVCGQRVGEVITPVGGGLRMSHVQIADEKVLTASPPSSDLFELPHRVVHRDSGSELMTLRLATSAHHSTIGFTWDHALADVGGAAHFLAHLSAAYAAQPLPPPPCHNRSLQRSHVAASSNGVVSACIAPHAPSVAITAPPPPAAEASSAQLTERTKGKKAVEGGVAYVEWSYSADELSTLKQLSGARTRHDALFADVVYLLRAAGHSPLDTVSLSRDDRKRFGLVKHPTRAPYTFPYAASPHIPRTVASLPLLLTRPHPPRSRSACSHGSTLGTGHSSLSHHYLHTPQITPRSPLPSASLSMPEPPLRSWLSRPTLTLRRGGTRCSSISLSILAWLRMTVHLPPPSHPDRQPLPSAHGSAPLLDSPT